MTFHLVVFTTPQGTGGGRNKKNNCEAVLSFYFNFAQFRVGDPVKQMIKKVGLQNLSSQKRTVKYIGNITGSCISSIRKTYTEQFCKSF
jgi:hypothetical protein